MQPGISRATSMGILGFLLGMLAVIVIRALQGLIPWWNPGSGIILSSLLASAFFMWGIGAFDPRWSVHAGAHGDEHEAGHDIVPAEAAPEYTEKPVAIFGQYIWQITFLLIALLVILGVAGLVPNELQLRQVGDDLGSTSGNAMIDFTLGDNALQVSELTIFAAFVIFTVISLAAAGALITVMFYFLSRGVTETRSTAPTDADRTPPLPVRLAGKGAGWLARKLRTSLPRSLGQK